MKPSRIFLAVLGVLLIGYASLGKGFAYLGNPPLYVGEIVLVLGLLCLLLGGGVRLALRSPISWLLLLYMSWGALRTYPYISVYGVDALRDAVIWGYGVFAFLVAAYVLRTGWLLRVPFYYGRVLPWYLVWIPICLCIQIALFMHGESGPLINGTPLFGLRSGEISIHYAGVMAFLILGLHRLPLAPTQTNQTKEWILWMLWFLPLVYLIASNRGALITIAGALFIFIVFRPVRFTAGSGGQFLLICVTATVLLLIGLFIGFEFDTGYHRKVSVSQIVSNVTSIFSDQSTAGAALEATKNWRVRFWNTIINDTMFGDYFWTGRGFGINVAEFFGFGTLDKTLRSPHNANFTILARAGVPGLTLWILLQITFGIALVRAYFRARRQGAVWFGKICFWIFSYWLACHIDATVEVFFEGPPGGIFFWSLFGFGIAVLETQGHFFLAPHETASRDVAYQHHQRLADPPAAVKSPRQI